MLEVRKAQVFDTTAMAVLLNQIIATGGTTAITEPVNAALLSSFMQHERAFWGVAEISGQIVGFQWIEPQASLPLEAANIATFVQEGQTGLGIGSQLFEMTKKAARAIGYTWINANIRADNTSGLTYYQSRGFRDWKRVEGVTLKNGLVVDKIYKRYDLD